MNLKRARKGITMVMMLGLSAIIPELKSMTKDVRGMVDLADAGVNITVFLLIVGLLLVPIGVSTILNTNKTAVGIVSGSTTETIFDNIVPIVFVVLILGLIYYMKRQSQ